MQIEWEEMFDDEEEFISLEDMATALRIIRNKIEKAESKEQLLKLPIVRNGRLATVGYCPDVWEKWIAEKKI